MAIWQQRVYDTVVHNHIIRNKFFENAVDFVSAVIGSTLWMLILLVTLSFQPLVNFILGKDKLLTLFWLLLIATVIVLCGVVVGSTYLIILAVTAWMEWGA